MSLLSPLSSPLASPLADALHADGPAADRADRMGLYGWLIGHWRMDAILPQADGAERRGRGEIHFGWVLEGRAIQDVWSLPAGDGSDGNDLPERAAFHGTTLRVYDPGIDAWHIVWTDPVKQAYRRMIGRARGADIVQDGVDETGAPVRWSFTEITPNSFRWLAERSSDNGATWALVVEFRARRTGA